MKTLSWITGLLTCAAVLLAALGALCGAVDRTAVDTQFYSGMSRAAAAVYLGAADDPQADEKVTEYIGLTDAEQNDFAQQMTRFMAGETDLQPDVLNEKEQQHMLDVRRLTQTAADMSRTCFAVAAGLAVAAAWTAAKLRRRTLPRLAGVLAAFTLTALVYAGVTAALRTSGFERMFVGMHELLFHNDLWLLNPRTDILIRMMPQPLFEQALSNAAGLALAMFAIVFVMLSAVHAIMHRMICRHVAKGESR